MLSHKFALSTILLCIVVFIFLITKEITLIKKISRIRNSPSHVVAVPYEKAPDNIEK